MSEDFILWEIIPATRIHLGVVGSVPLQDLYTDEISALHLNDRNSDQALLHRGAQQGTVELSSPSGGFKSTIPRNGEVRSTSSNPKGLFTTMLSSLPQTQIHQRVFNPTSDEPNNFKWVVDDFSDAGKYQTWHDLLARVEQELSQIRSSSAPGNHHLHRQTTSVRPSMLNSNKFKHEFKQKPQRPVLRLPSSRATSAVSDFLEHEGGDPGVRKQHFVRARQKQIPI